MSLLNVYCYIVLRTAPDTFQQCASNGKDACLCFESDRYDIELSEIWLEIIPFLFCNVYRGEALLALIFKSTASILCHEIYCCNFL